MSNDELKILNERFDRLETILYFIVENINIENSSISDNLSKKLMKIKDKYHNNQYPLL